jgi:hypothetical protein
MGDEIEEELRTQNSEIRMKAQRRILCPPFLFCNELELFNFLCSAYGVAKTRKTRMAMQAMFRISEAARRSIASLQQPEANRKN